MRPIRLAVGVACLLALVTATMGCSHRHYISKADFLRRGDAICRRTTIHLRNLRPDTGESDPGREQQYIRIVADEVARSIDRVRNIGYPKGDQTRVDGWFGEYEGALRTLASNPTTTGGINVKAFTGAVQGLKSYGFKECGVVQTS